jgi:hypothetical protein
VLVITHGAIHPEPQIQGGKGNENLSRHKTHVIFTSLVLICGLPVLATQAADQPSGGSPPVVLTGEPAMMAVGAVEDTLKACLARIPKDGSGGQRMLATQSCEQYEGTRKASQDAPKF